MAANVTAPAAAAPAIPFVIFDGLLEQTYGILLAGTFVSCCLFGVISLQVFLYYTRLGRARDPIFLRLLPAFLIIVEFVHQVLLCVAIYKILINNFGNEGVAVLIVPELFIAGFLQGFCALSAHLFYTYRIAKFSKGLWIVPCLTIPLTLTQLGFTFANNALTLIHRDIAYLATITYTVYVTHGINVFLDLFFVVAMIMLLTRERQSFRPTQLMIHRLMVLIINTGLITALATLLTIIFVGAEPATFVYAFFNILISPLYGNSIMANLNSRDYIRGDVNGSAGTIELSAIQLATHNNTTRGTGSVTTVQEDCSFADGVKISKATVTSDDFHYPVN